MKKTFNIILSTIAIGASASLVHGAVSPLAACREYLMGTVAEVRVYAAPDAQSARSALEAALGELRAIDHLMAVQRPDSDVSRINREAARGPVRVDRRVIEVLEASLAMSRLTEGAFDVTVLPAVEAWGFLDGRPAPPAAGVHPVIAGYRTLALDRDQGTVAFRSPATAVDLGGIAKGYALDRARDVLRARGVRTAWLDLGGNLATIGVPPDATRWRVGIRDPRSAGALLGVVEIGEASVSTSSDEIQYALEDGARRGHIFDPHTGRPAAGLVSATVIAASGTQADALSTAAVVLGPERGRAAVRSVDAEGVFATADARGGLILSATDGARFTGMERTNSSTRTAECRSDEGGTNAQGRTIPGRGCDRGRAGGDFHGSHGGKPG